MAVEDPADLASFFDEDEFGSLAVYRAQGTGPRTDVVGILENGYASPALGALAGEGREITFRCAAGDLPAAQQGDTLTVGRTVYRVRSARPDGTGVLILILAS